MSIVLVMGVSGSGKTTIAAGIAQEQGWVLVEGDTFHPPANVEKMKAGIPLSDEDRWPWLRAIAVRVDELSSAGQSVVIACSALKRSYRKILLGDRAGSFLIYLRGTKELIRQRLVARRGHFMPPALLDSQFSDLEEPAVDEQPLILEIDRPPAKLVANALHWIQKGRYE